MKTNKQTMRIFYSIMFCARANEKRCVIPLEHLKDAGSSENLNKQT